ncbi:MAG: ATP-binding protein [Clostridiaceae bacterium]
MDVLELFEARHQSGSIIFCIQFDPKGWQDKIDEATLSDAILDRIVHDSNTIFIDEHVSMRESHGIKE